MKYGSVCSGIEAASVAWESLGWQAQWYSEIEHFPSAVLAHRFPTVPNLGDMTQIHNTEHFNGTTINLLVGGTPCQSFSVAGLRKGLDDSRGQLMLTFVELAARKRPRWVVWENVPGVLSSNKGGDFASFLGLLTGRDIQAPVGGWSNSGCIEGISSAYGVAWTMLDAQDFGVAQRRKRIFVIGYLGDWRPAAAVLFERNRLQGDTTKSREKRKATSADAQGGVGSSGIPRVSGSLDTEFGGGKLTHQSVNNGHLIPEPMGAFRMTAFGEYADDDTASTLKQRDYKDATDLIAHKASWWNGEQTAATLTKQNANGAQRMPDKDNFGAVLEPKAHAFKVRGGSETETGEQGGTKKAGKGYLGQDEKAFTIGTTQDRQIAQPIVYENHPADSRVKEMGETCQTVSARFGTGGGNVPLVQQPIAVDCYNQTINHKTSQTIGSSASDVNHYGAVLQPIAFDTFNQTTSNVNQTIKSPQGGLNESIGVIAQPTIIDRAAFNQGANAQYDIKITQGETMSSLVAKVPHGVATQKPPTMAIRRLTPTECERLQGFPDGHTKIPYRNKPADQCPDGPRYKACGNSMAVPCMAWLGQRIQMVDNILNPPKS